MPRPSKRPQFIAAAREIIHELGYEHASLADVADRADLPVGNLYYYFKTKASLAVAVIDSYVVDLDSWLATLDARDEPRERLLGYIDGLVDGYERKTRFGCPMLSLVSELGKRGDALGEHAGSLVQIQLRWLRRTLNAMGADQPTRAAEDWLSLIAGSYALAQARRDIGTLERRRRHLRRLA